MPAQEGDKQDQVEMECPGQDTLWGGVFYQLLKGSLQNGKLPSQVTVGKGEPQGQGP